VNLSICIPNFNRPRYLAWTLAKLSADFPDAELVISDDASTEQYSGDIPSGTKWIPNLFGKGPFPNHRLALLGATRKYAVYCANDDYLIPEGISAGLEYLEAHPDCVAYIAPAQVWNEVEQSPFWNAFRSQDQNFRVTDGIDLFNFIISHHVWPEHVIYRAPIPLSPRTSAYWCFTDLVDLLQTGYLHFSTQPFYRNLIVHPLDAELGRIQLGNEQCLTHFDQYRGGLEVLAFGLFGEQPYATRHKIHDMIASFICQRLLNASRIQDARGNHAEAEMLRQRIVIASPVSDKDRAAKCAA
jgi:Glycosyl transferase family 2